MGKKTQKKRGSREHGRGRKAGRGAGLRGGRGQAGAMKHKRAGTVKRNPNYWGKHGFTRPDAVVEATVAINVQALDEGVDDLLQDGKATEDGDAVQVDLGALDVDKLLGSGQVHRALHVTVAEASASAVRKIEAAGGSVTLTKVEEDEAPEDDEETD